MLQSIIVDDKKPLQDTQIIINKILVLITPVGVNPKPNLLSFQLNRKDNRNTNTIIKNNMNLNQIAIWLVTLVTDNQQLELILQCLTNK